MDARTTGALLGMIFGDAHINVRERLKDGVYPYTSSEMRIVHGTQQRAYAEFKCALVNKLLLRNCSCKEVANGPGGKYRAVGFSVSHPYFKLLKSWCYPNGKKTFTEQNLNHLTPEGIALWYMDDGHARRNYNSDGRVSSVGTSIATCCPIEEALLVCGWFREVHKIDFRPYNEKGLWSIRVNTEHSRLFAHLVQPYIIEPMMYKLAHVADLSSHECRAPICKCACGANIYSNTRRGMCVACYSRRYYRATVRPRRSTYG